MKQFLLSIREVLEVILISFLTVYLVRAFIVQPFLVSGASMEPTFGNGNYLLVDELSYAFRSPYRGEVVVFRYPGDPKVYYIKRVVGLPGERVVVHDGRTTIYNADNPKGFSLTESYIASDIITTGNVDTILDADEFFVLGDNRYYSFDSRNWGTLPLENILGVVRVRLFPFTAVQTFRAPEYQLLQSS